MLQGGKTLQRFVTIPEGMPSIMAQERIMAAPELTGKIDRPGGRLAAARQLQLPARRHTRVGVDHMQRAMTAYLAKAWAKRKPGLVSERRRKRSILASIVEKETGKPSERRMVAAVYSNRLKRGMMLQADPTIIYPITFGKALGRRILLSEKNAKNDYNTYTMTGLPKGPIANPGRASIDAVLNPADSNALYFVADGTGGSVFADTLEQHNANVQKWYAIRRARGRDVASGRSTLAASQPRAFASTSFRRPAAHPAPADAQHRLERQPFGRIRLADPAGRAEFALVERRGEALERLQPADSPRRGRI